MHDRATFFTPPPRGLFGLVRRHSTQNEHRPDDTQTTLRGNGCQFRSLAPNMTNSGGMCISWEPSTISDTNMDLLVLDIQSDESQRDLVIYLVTLKSCRDLPQIASRVQALKQVHVSI